MNPTDQNFVSFVVTAVTTEEFPPRTYSAPYWEVTRTVALELIANELAEAYEIFDMDTPAQVGDNPPITPVDLVQQHVI